jgi:hypothetical protein
MTRAEFNRIYKKMWRDYWAYKKLGLIPTPKAKIIRTLNKLEKRVKS